MATKTECITQSGAYHTLLCFIEGEVQIVVNLLILIILLMVDRRRNDIIVNSEDRCHRFYCAGSTQQVACH